MLLFSSITGLSLSAIAIVVAVAVASLPTTLAIEPHLKPTRSRSMDFTSILPPRPASEADDEAWTKWKTSAVTAVKEKVIPSDPSRWFNFPSLSSSSSTTTFSPLSRSGYFTARRDITKYTSYSESPSVLVYESTLSNKITETPVPASEPVAVIATLIYRGRDSKTAGDSAKLANEIFASKIKKLSAPHPAKGHRDILDFFSCETPNGGLFWVIVESDPVHRSSSPSRPPSPPSLSRRTSFRRTSSRRPSMDSN